MGRSPVLKHTFISSLKRFPSSLHVTLLLTHLMLISLSTASLWNRWHLNCPLAGNKVKTPYRMVKDTLNNHAYPFPLCQSYATRFINFHPNTAFPHGKRGYSLEACKKWLENAVFNNENCFLLVKNFRQCVTRFISHWELANDQNLASFSVSERLPLTSIATVNMKTRSVRMIIEWNV